MKHSVSIEILRPLQQVFDLATNPSLAPQWNKTLQSVEILSKGPWGARSQVKWVMDIAGEKLEIIETMIEFEPPNITASSYEFTRFIPPPAEEITSKKQQIIFSESALDKRFRFNFGKNRPIGFLVNEFSAINENATLLHCTDDLQIGGSFGLLYRLALTFRQKPLKKTLMQTKSMIENSPPRSTIANPDD